MVLLLLLLLLLGNLGLGPGTAAGQQTMPFPGNGQEPEDPVTVYVSSYIDRLMYIDDKNYEFQALVFVYLSWTDPRARKAVAANMDRLARNSSETCKLACQLYPQNQQNPRQGCCDDVWLPYVSFPTLKLLSQDRVLRSGVNIEPGSDAVAYWNIILGTFMASFDLRGFPFDAQRLHVQMEIPGWAGGNVRLQPSSGGTRMFNTNPDGDALSGWRVMSVRMSTYALPLCQRYTVSSSQPSALADPAPLVSELLYTDKRIRARPSTCEVVLDDNRNDPAFLAYTRQNLDGSDALRDRALNVTGVTCTITIQRYVAQWIMSAILPIVASTWLGFVVFLLPRDCMNSRLGAVMTIFVALAAIQFVVAQDLPNSSYMTALQQLIAAGYVTLSMIGIESVFIWWITTYHSTGKRLAAHLAARQHYQAELKLELDSLKAKLAVLLAEQERQHGTKPSLSRSFAGMKALTMRRLSKSARSVQRMSSGSTVRSTSSAATDERAAAAALAVKAADCSHHKRQECEANSAPLPSLVQLAPADDGGQLDTTDRQGDVVGDVSVHRNAPDQIKGTEQVIRQVSRLQKQLADMAAQDAKRHMYGVQRSAISDGSIRVADRGSFTTLGFGATQPHLGQASPLSAVSAVPADAAADADAVLLDVGAADADQRKQVPVGCWFHWRWCTRMRVYLNALKDNETLTDQLSYQINKWVAILQFLAYNAAAVLIFVVNWALYRKQ